MTHHIGKTIRILRTARELKLSELAEGTGLSVAYLSLVENGERQPSVDVLRRVAKALRVPSESLVLLALSAEAALRSRDPKTVSLTRSIQELVRVEGKLRALLDSQGDSGGPEEREAS
jgi:transcriptional regulator with XRE-family HTH domain